MNQKEQLFYEKLKEIFIGEKIEGKSGFANLMRMKSAYFDKVFEEIDEEIKEKTEEFPDFREELYNKLYTFLKRYFTDSGSILYKRTTPESKIYEKVYDNEKDVSLFWKTNMLYYVKTKKIWKPITIEDHDINGETFDIEFDVSELEGKRGNTKKGIIFELDNVEDDKIVFDVTRPSHGSKTKTDEIRKSLNREDVPINKKELEHIFKTYKKQNEVDFFINKDAEKFLKEQFDMWIKHYVIDDETIFQENRLKKIKTLRDIVYKIINFVSNFENELAKIWNKPKFVLNSNYVVTLGKVVDRDGGLEIVKKVSEQDDFENQVEEWKKLGFLSDSEELDGFTEDGEFKSEYRFFPLDTKYFEDIKFEILSLFDNINENLDGWAINSENYQALNVITPKFEKEVRTVYIDPPYNREREFVYKDKYKDASWICLMENRLEMSKDLMSDKGVIFSSVDDNESDNLRKLMDEIFGEENFISQCIWKKKAGGGADAKYFAEDHEYVLCYAKEEKNTDRFLVRMDEELKSTYNRKDEHYKDRGPYKRKNLHQTGIETDRPNLKYEIEAPDGSKIEPPTIWRWEEERFKKAREEGKIDFARNVEGDWKVYTKMYLKDENGKIRQVKPRSILKDVGLTRDGNKEIQNLFGYSAYDYPKPTALITKLLDANDSRDQLVIDFFAGSGTTGEAVLNMNKEDDGGRKFILIEMSDLFEEVLVSRLKKSAYSSTWDNGQPQDSEGTDVFFKYYSLEQYEEALEKCRYESSDPFSQTEESSYDQYVFLNDKKMLEAINLDFEKEKENIDFSNLYSEIDLAETLSNLKGKKIKQISGDSVTFEDDEKIEFDNIDFETIKPLIWW